MISNDRNEPKTEVNGNDRTLLTWSVHSSLLKDELPVYQLSVVAHGSVFSGAWTLPQWMGGCVIRTSAASLQSMSLCETDILVVRGCCHNEWVLVSSEPQQQISSQCHCVKLKWNAAPVSCHLTFVCRVCVCMPVSVWGECLCMFFWVEISYTLCNKPVKLYWLWWPHCESFSRSQGSLKMKRGCLVFCFECV